MKEKKDSSAAERGKNNETVFWIRNFTLYANVTHQRDYSMVEASVLFFLSFYFMIVAFSHGYKEYSSAPYSSLQDFLNATSYSNMFSLLTMMAPIYKAMLYTFSIIAIAFFLLFLYFIINNKTKARSSILSTIFKFLCKYYSWLFFFPTNMLFFSRIMCTDAIMNPMNIICGYSGSTNLVEVAVATIGLFGSTFMTFWTSIYFCSSNYRKKNYLASNHPAVYLFMNARKLISALLLTISSDSFQYLIFFLGANLACSLILLFYFFKRIPFAKFIILKEAIFYETAHLSICLGFILDELTRSRSYEGSNAVYFCGGSFILLEILSQYYLRYLIESIALEFQKNEEKISFSNFLKRIEVLDLLTSSIDEKENLLFKGIMERHMRECVKEGCFCKKDVMYDSKKNKEFNLYDKYSHKSIFAKLMIKSSYENYMLWHPKESLPLIYFAEFLFEKMKNLHLALLQLTLAERRVLMINQRNKVYIVRKNIRNYNKKVNTTSFKGKLEIEAVVFTEEQMDKILDIMKKIITSNIKLWTVLEKKEVDLNEMNDIFESQSKYFQEANKLWKTLKNYMDSKKQIKFYYQWYMRNLMNKKVRISDEETRLDNEEELMSIHSADLINTNKDDKLIFQYDSGIVHVSGNSGTLGKILKLSVGFNKVFGYNKGELINSTVNSLMPAFFSKKHDEYIKNYIEVGKPDVLYNQIYVFARDKMGFIFPTWIILKQFITLIGGIEYIGMIKPLRSKHDTFDYIILNEFGDIDSVTRKVAENLFFTPEFLQKVNINILIVAPKLMKYFFFNKFIEEPKDKPEEKKEEKKQDDSDDEEADDQREGKGLHNKLSSVLNRMQRNPQKKNPDLLSLGAMRKPTFLNQASRNLPPAELVSPSKNKALLLAQQTLKSKAGPRLPSILGTTQSIMKESQNSALKSTGAGNITPTKLFLRKTMGPNDEKLAEETLESPQLTKKESSRGPFQTPISAPLIKLSSNPFSNMIQKKKAEQAALSALMVEKPKEKEIDQEPQDQGSEKTKGHGYQSSDSSDDDDDNLSTTRITFTLRVPKNLEKYSILLKTFISNEKKQLASGSNDGAPAPQTNQNSVVNSKSTVPQNGFSILINNNPSANQNKSSERDPENDELLKKELDYVKDLSTRISKLRNCNIFSIQATVSTKSYYGNRDTLKVIKIMSITKKVEKFDAKGFFEQEVFKRDLKHSMIMSDTSITSLEKQKSKSKFSLFNHFINVQDESSPALLGIPKQKSILQQTSLGSDNNFDDDKKGNFRINSLRIPSLVPFEDRQVSDGKLLSSQGEQNLKSSDIVAPGITSIQNTITKNPGIDNLNAKNFSIENIFIKDENLKAHKKLGRMKRVKWIIRSFFFLIFTLSLLTYFIGPNQTFASLKNSADKIFLCKKFQLNILETYNNIMNLLYFRGNQSLSSVISEEARLNFEQSQVKTITGIYQYFANNNANDILNTVLYDSNLVSLERNVKYDILKDAESSADNVEIYVLELFKKYLTKLNNFQFLANQAINNTDSDVIFMRTYIIPDLFNMFKLAGDNLISSIMDSITNLKNILISIIVVEATVFVISFLVLLRLILQITVSFEAILEVFAEIDIDNVKSFKLYFQELLERLNWSYSDDTSTAKGSISHADKEPQNSEEIKKKEQQQKKSKKIIKQNFLLTLKKSILFYYLLFIFTSSILSVGFFIMVQQTTERLDSILVSGQEVLSQTTTDTYLNIAMKESLYDRGGYQNNFMVKNEKEIKANLQRTRSVYNPESSGTFFDDAFRTYFYGEPCKFNSVLTEGQSNECESLALNKLTLGISAFNALFGDKITDLVILDEAKLTEATVREVYEFDKAVEYINVFMLDIALIWSADFDRILDDDLSNLTIYVCFMLLILVFVFLVAEKLVVKRLTKSYQYFRNIYMNYLPNSIVARERMVKAKLVINKILNK